MALYNIKTVVEYYYEVEADSIEEAEQAGWDYEEYPFSAEVYSIDVEEVDESEEENSDE